MDQKLLSRLQRLCAQKECCSSELIAKATKLLEGDSAAAEEIIAALVQDGYLDDARYAGAFARDKAAFAGWGPLKISFALRGKGIAKKDIEAAIATIDEFKALDKLEGALRTKCKSLQGDSQIRLKLLKFALGKGFEYGPELVRTVEKVISES